MRFGIVGSTGGRTSKFSRLAADRDIQFVPVERREIPEDVWLVVLVGQEACQRMFGIDLDQAVGVFNWIDGVCYTGLGEGLDGLIDLSAAIGQIGFGIPTSGLVIRNRAKHTAHMTGGWSLMEQAVLARHHNGKLKAIKEVNRIKKYFGEGGVTLQYWR